MDLFHRFEKNPILGPAKENSWESAAAFNGCPLTDGKRIHFVYRAVSKDNVSSIGYASSTDGVHFTDRHQLIVPEHDWERYGCEDPRITKFEGVYYIFYTALSKFPFEADGIKIGLAITKDFKTFEKHLITPFNAKAMALFPERVNGKIAVILTVHTDRPPVHIAIALFDAIEDLWSPAYWKNWYASLDEHVLDLKRNPRDHLEVGTPPLKTKNGWLLLYSYIRNYASPSPIFGIESLLLDLNDPMRIEGRSGEPLFMPQEPYERFGNVPNIVFPSGAFIRDKRVFLYYGAADTTCCMASASLPELLKHTANPMNVLVGLRRFSDNPIIQPDPTHAWEEKATFNPGAVYLDGKVHLLYRALSENNTSSFGYASSADGFRIDTRLPDPVYEPCQSFEKRSQKESSYLCFEEKTIPGANSGCEDPRITKIGNTLHILYTAFNGSDPPRVAYTSILVPDFLAQNWNWLGAQLISPPGIDDKDAALFPEKINGSYVLLHRLGISIWLDFVPNLKFGNQQWIGGKIIMDPRSGEGDSRKIGIAGPPLKTSEGWLLLYHGISRKEDHHYHLRAALLDLRDPANVLVRTRLPILEPRMPYETDGLVNRVVFSCGVVVIQNTLFVYYGAADKVTAVASMPLAELLTRLKNERRQKA